MFQNFCAAGGLLCRRAPCPGGLLSAEGKVAQRRDGLFNACGELI